MRTTRAVDVLGRVGRMTHAEQKRLVRDLCGETFGERGRGPFRFLRVREDGSVERCWMWEAHRPVTSCTLKKAVAVILRQQPDHPMVRALIERVV